MTISESAPKELVLVGLMSGTSLDGISAAVAHFRDNADGIPQATLLAFTQRPYSAAERGRLEAACREGSAREYCRLNVDLADWLAAAAIHAIHDAGLTSHDIAAVASHGQTLWHEPGHSTWQIGDAARIAERTQCAVVSDFRSRDVAAGGQGAPLVPMADAMLFSHAHEWRALQNLGGIGNVTIVPPSSSIANGGLSAVRAFDTGPGCVVIDTVTRALHPQLSYDADGALARAGTVIETVVRDALAHPYFAQHPPKSTGRELYTREFAAAFMRACLEHGASDTDVVATTTAFTARSIVDQYERFITEPIRDVLLSGGGSKNLTLVRFITDAIDARAATRHTNTIAVKRFEDVFFDGEAKEAVAFALLGYLHLSGRSGNLPSATGARGPRILGALTPA